MMSRWMDRSRIAGGIALGLLGGVVPTALGQEPHEPAAVRVAPDGDRLTQPFHIKFTQDPHQGHLATAHAKIGVDCAACHLPVTTDPVRLGLSVDQFARSSFDPLGLKVVAAGDALRSQLDLEAKSGLVVTEVRPKGAGAEAGFKAHDILLSVGDAPLREPGDLKKAVGEGGKELSVRLVRAGKRKTIEVTPEAAKPLVMDFQFQGIPQPGQPMPEYWIGISVAPVEPTLRSQLGIGEKVGILASSVVPESPAAKAGVKSNDIIKSVGGKPVSDSPSLIASVQEAKGKPVPLELIRAGKPMTLEVQPEKRPVARLASPVNREAEDMFRSLTLRPGVVVPNQDPTATGFRPLPPHPHGGNVADFYTLNAAAPARQAEIDAKLNALAEQLKELQKSIDELKKGRKEK